jgi:hypothetical protein
MIEKRIKVASPETLLFAQVSLGSLVRAERSGRVPRRFTESGQAVWQTFHNELTIADLAAIAIQDAGIAMPMPFAPSNWWPQWPDWALLHLSPQDVQT